MGRVAAENSPMSLSYTTEYTVGRRGRIRRTYTGVQALIAIAFDLALGSVFALIRLTCWMVGAILQTSFRVTLAVLSLPLLLARAIIPRPRPLRPTGKPAWAAAGEL